MSARIFAGLAVHALTASGAICGLIALHYVASHQWSHVFLWLGAAAIIDAVDGPVARKVQVEIYLRRYSGVRLDLVVDFLNYCVIPAFIVMESGLAGKGYGLLAGAIMLMSSLFHFADKESKTEDGFFVGFPALWNVVCLYIFVFNLGPAGTFAAIVALAVATFIPVKWLHPVRVSRWRPLTIVVTVVWAGAALHEVIQNFPGAASVRVIFGVCALYYLTIGALRTLKLNKFK